MLLCMSSVNDILLSLRDWVLSLCQACVSRYHGILGIREVCIAIAIVDKMPGQSYIFCCQFFYTLSK